MNKSDAVYLLLGPEVGEKDLFIERLIERITKTRGGRIPEGVFIPAGRRCPQGRGEGEAPEIHKFYPFDTDLVDVLTVLQNGTLFANYRIVILSNVEVINKDRDIRLLAGYCANPVSNATLLLLSEEIQKHNKQLERAIPKENKLIFWELFENQKKGWIISFFRKKGITIDNRASDFLLEMVENNTRQLKLICEKLALFFGQGAGIEYKDIEKILFHSKDENVFTLFERVSRRDLGSALEVLQKILLSREAEPVQLLRGLLNQFRKLMAYKQLLAENYTLGEAFAHLRVRSKKLQRVYQEGGKQYSRAELEKIVMLTARFDLRLRSLKSNLQALILQLFLYYAIRKGGRGAWCQLKDS